MGGEDRRVRRTRSIDRNSSASAREWGPPSLVDAYGRGSQPGAAVALAAGLQSSEEVGEVHGLGTADWLDADLGQEFAVAPGGKIGGKIKLRGGPGLGFVPEIPEGMSVGAGLEISS